MKIKLEQFDKPLEVLFLDDEGKVLEEMEDPESEKMYIAGNAGDSYRIQIKNPNEASRGGGDPVYINILAEGIPVFGRNPNPNAEIAARSLTQIVQEVSPSTDFEVTGWKLNGNELGKFMFVDKKDYSYIEEIGQLNKANLQSIKVQAFVSSELDDRDEPDFDQVIHYLPKQILIARKIMEEKTASGLTPYQYVAQLVGSPKAHNKDKKNIYALVVGINDYPIPAHKLSGCINDATSIVEFLTTSCETDEVSTHVKYLFDRDATRANIIDGFKNHLTQATEKDVVFFYFCGHGAREKCPEEFKYMHPDGFNQSIVCADSRDPDNPKGTDLADKELGYLIHLVSSKTKAHTVVIMDCCHSGAATRDVSDNPVIRTRKIDTAAEARTLDSFVFFDDPNLKSWFKGGEIFIPQGKHIALGAAKNIQTAKETTFAGEQRGAFTHFLKQTLASSPQITYKDLMVQVRAKLKGSGVPDQEPQDATIGGEDVNTLFLNGSAAPKEENIYAVYDQKRKGWYIKLGKVHGMPPVDPDDYTKLVVLPADMKAKDLENWTKFILDHAEITNVMTGESKISFCGENDFEASTEKSYKVKIVHIGTPKVKFIIEGNDQEGVKNLRERVAIDAGEIKADGKNDFTPTLRTVVLATDPLQAEFRIVAENGLYNIKRFGEDRTLCKQQKVANLDTAGLALSDLEAIVRWHALRLLANPDTNLPEDALELSFYASYNPDYIPGKRAPKEPKGRNVTQAQRDEYQGILAAFLKEDAEGKDEKNKLPNLNEYRFEYKKVGSDWQFQYAFLKVQNTFNKLLYFTCIGFDYCFGINVKNYVPDGVIELNPGEVVWLSMKKPILMGFALSYNPEYDEEGNLIDLGADYREKRIFESNIKEVTNLYKLFYSTVTFETNFYAQPSMDLADAEKSPGTRNVLPARPEQPDWATIDISCTIVNPMYDPAKDK